MKKHSCVLRFGLAITLSCLLPGVARAATYHVERLTADLHIPVFATTAPGDNNRVFVAQLGGVAADGTDGDPITKSEGRIVIYDRTTGLVDYNNPFLTISDTSLFEGVPTPEVGLFALAFHPDFQTNGKFYVNVAVSHTGPAPIVDGLTSPFKTVVREYTASAGNPNVADLSSARTILSLNQPVFNHNGSWMGFSPQEVEDGHRYLYVTQGDGGNQHDPNNHAQNKNDWFGKVMRVDLDGDAFPEDAERNYAIPPDNPFVDADGADELWAYGLRNPWRASFDRETSDFWIGDVGQGRREEIDFQSASSPGGANYGWRLREGSVATPRDGVGGPPPPDNVNPVYEYFHSAGNPPFEGRSVTGGYVYRGPIEELQGRYFLGDAVSGHIWSFDPSDPHGTVQLMDSLLAPDEGSFISITSFGEDEEGNLLIVDGAGQLFQIVPNFEVTLTVDRDTGAMTLLNHSGAAVGIDAYSLSSSVGAINAATFTPITGNFDAPPGGDGSIDPNDDWQITSQTLSLFSEDSLGDGGSLGVGQQLALSSAGGWIPSPIEDLSLSLTLADGSIVTGTVEFVGNDGAAFGRSDLTFDGILDVNDWLTFTAHHLEVLAGLSDAQQYGRGDLDADGDNDFADFRIFKADFDAENGAGALAQLLGGVPEPSGTSLVFIACVLLSFRTSGRSPRR